MVLGPGVAVSFHCGTVDPSHNMLTGDRLKNLTISFCVICRCISQLSIDLNFYMGVSAKEGHVVAMVTQCTRTQYISTHLESIDRRSL